MSSSLVPYSILPDVSPPLRVMTPPLPPELLVEILGWATLDEEPAQRQETRRHFRSVCRGWNDSFDSWKEVHVTTLGELVRLGLSVTPGNINSGDRALGIRTLTLDRRLPSYDVERSAALLASVVLLQAVKHLDNLKIMGDPVLVDPFVPPELDRNLARAVCGLAQLRQLSFIVTGAASDRNDWPTITPSQLDKLALSCPQLEVLHFEGLRISSSRATYTPFRFGNVYTHASLKSVTLSYFDDFAALEATLLSLPCTLVNLAIDDSDNYSAQSASIFQKSSLARLTQLVDLSVLDLNPFAQNDDEAFTASRGSFDALLAALPQLERLAVSPCAITNLSSSLARLTRLQSLSLHIGCFQLFEAEAVRPAEVTAFIEDAPSLRRLSICSETCAGWSCAERVACEQAAHSKGIKLHWIE